MESGPRNPTIVEPWGGNGGTSWDDGIYTGIREIRLAYGLCIDSIHIEYDKNGNPVLAKKHGGNGGHCSANIKLIYPDEYLVAVSGHYGPFLSNGMSVIRSLTFKTNQKSFGPYGVEEGKPFTFSMEGDLIVGFIGRSGLYLDAIGFRLSSIQPTTSICRKAPSARSKGSTFRGDPSHGSSPRVTSVGTLGHVYGAVDGAAGEAGPSEIIKLPPMNVHLPHPPSWSFWDHYAECTIECPEIVPGLPVHWPYVPAHRYEDVVRLSTGMRNVIIERGHTIHDLWNNLEEAQAQIIKLQQQLQERRKGGTRSNGGGKGKRFF